MPFSVHSYPNSLQSPVSIAFCAGLRKKRTVCSFWTLQQFEAGILQLSPSVHGTTFAIPAFDTNVPSVFGLLDYFMHKSWVQLNEYQLCGCIVGKRCSVLNQCSHLFWCVCTWIWSEALTAFNWIECICADRVWMVVILFALVNIQCDWFVILNVSASFGDCFGDQCSLQRMAAKLDEPYFCTQHNVCICSPAASICGYTDNLWSSLLQRTPPPFAPTSTALFWLAFYSTCFSYIVETIACKFSGRIKWNWFVEPCWTNFEEKHQVD